MLNIYNGNKVRKIQCEIFHGGEIFPSNIWQSAITNMW